MNGLQRIGGFAALYLALAYVIGIVLFLVVLDYPSITDPAQKVALVVDKQPVIYASNLILYVVFGSFLGGPIALGGYWPVLLIALGALFLFRSLVSFRK